VYGCETFSLILREEHELWEFENRMLKEMFSPKRDKVTGGGEDRITRSFVICTFRQLELSSQGGRGWQGILREWGRRGTCIGV
jgi:hypothetical protein